MAQSVVYADLKFAVAAPACPTAHDEDDSPYENVPLGPVAAEPNPGRWPRRWRVPAGLLAGSLLLLLLLVATVTLGACYWQVTRSLQDTSHEHEAERSRLSQEVSAREQSLEQTRLELAWARAELQRAWREGNGSQLELGSLSAELKRLTGVLGKTEKEMQEVQGKLNSSESTARRLRACVNTECCPSGWVLYRSKCLFISVGRKSCRASHEDCRKKDARLLVQGNWPSWTMPDFLQANDVIYWIGAQFSDRKLDVFWQDSKQMYFSDCKLLSNSKTESSRLWSLYPWICEKPPELTNTSKTLLPLLAKA